MHSSHLTDPPAAERRSAFRGGHCGTFYIAGRSVLDAAKTLDNGVPRQCDSDQRVSRKADRTHLQRHRLPRDFQDPLHAMRLPVIDPNNVTNGKHARGPSVTGTASPYAAAPTCAPGRA